MYTYILCFCSKDVGVTNVLFSAEEKFLAAALRYDTHYHIVIHRIGAILHFDWLKYSQYISSYTASSEKQNGGTKTERVLFQKKRNF